MNWKRILSAMLVCAMLTTGFVGGALAEEDEEIYEEVREERHAEAEEEHDEPVREEREAPAEEIHTEIGDDSADREPVEEAPQVKETPEVEESFEYEDVGEDAPEDAPEARSDEVETVQERIQKDEEKPREEAPADEAPEEVVAPVHNDDENAIEPVNPEAEADPEVLVDELPIAQEEQAGAAKISMSGASAKTVMPGQKVTFGFRVTDAVYVSYKIVGPDGETQESGALPVDASSLSFTPGAAGKYTLVLIAGGVDGVEVTAKSSVSAEKMEELKIAVTADAACCLGGQSVSFSISLPSGVEVAECRIVGTQNRSVFYESAQFESKVSVTPPAVNKVTDVTLSVSVTDVNGRKAEGSATLRCAVNAREKRSQWEATMRDVVRTGVWPMDLIAIAKTQVGYKESSVNFGEKHGGGISGYTRYGDWAGMRYDEWCAMFCSFCLNYAGVPESAFPWASNCQRWIEKLRKLDLYASQASYVPQLGDLVFFEWENDNDSDHVGIIAELDVDRNGNVNGFTTIEGNSKGGAVTFNEYYALTDRRVVGYGLVNAAYVRMLESEGGAAASAETVEGAVPEVAPNTADTAVRKDDEDDFGDWDEDDEAFVGALVEDAPERTDAALFEEADGTPFEEDDEALFEEDDDLFEEDDDWSETFEEEPSEAAFEDAPLDVSVNFDGMTIAAQAGVEAGLPAQVTLRARALEAGEEGYDLFVDVLRDALADGEDLGNARMLELSFVDARGDAVVPQAPVALTVTYDGSLNASKALRPGVATIGGADGVDINTNVKLSRTKDSSSYSFEQSAFDGVICTYVAGKLKYRMDTAEAEAGDVDAKVGYSAKAKVPSGVALELREIEPGTTDYEACLARVDDAAPGETLRFFELELSLNGMRIEPAEPVKVTLTCDQPAKAATAVRIHDGAMFDVKLDTKKDDRLAVSFETDALGIFAVTFM